MAERSVSAAPRVSVVIATLGGDSLRTTIERLNEGSSVPAEILVCIPEREARAVSAGSHANVRILATDFRGQVAQRAFGFRHVSHDLVMQLDDDVVVDSRCLEFLVRDLEASGPRSAVAPAWRWRGTDRSVYKPISPLLGSGIFFWLLNGRRGYRPGIVTKAGAEIGIHERKAHGTAVDAEWIPGGCVLHRRKDLVLEDYFPFPGKAFCEDLIHSFHLSSRGVRLLVSPDALAYIDEAPQARGEFFKALRGDFRARRHYVELSSRSKLRMYFFFFARILRHVSSRR